MKDPGFEELKTALEKHDIDMAFENAHTLKGVLSNLGLAPLSEQMGQIVETLRFGSEEGLLKKYQELEIQIEGFKSV